MFMNATGTIGAILGNAAAASIGSIVIVLLLLFLVLFALCLMFGIPLEYTAVVMLPLILSYMAYYQEFYILGGALFVYIALIITKNWLFK